MMIRTLSRFFRAPAPLAEAPIAVANNDHANAISALEAKIEYLHYEVSKLRSQVRYLSGPEIRKFPLYQQTMDSFNFQWSGTVSVGWNQTDIDSIQETILRFTGLDRSWFAGKDILDAGCGSGRFALGLATLGAKVVAIDQSSSAIQTASERCRDLAPSIKFQVHNLLDPLSLDTSFDLVWSFGVLHHTGDTYAAFRNISRLVKPGGYLFLMLYGEPGFDDLGAFEYYAEVEKLRRATYNLSLNDRHDYLVKLKADEAGGWFDAVSPIINDTYSFHEIEAWLVGLGFVDIKRTIDHPSHHVIARRA